MWLVLCASNDISALWAYQGLKARSLAPLEFVSTEMLTSSARWEHRLGEDGVSLEITLADGRTIDNTTTLGVLNRIPFVPPERLLVANPVDRDYAAQELTAFFMSWLNALPQPVLNRPTAQGLSGQWRDVSEWVWLASKAGLPTSGYRQSSRDHIDEIGVERKLVPIGTPVNTVIVVQGHVVGAPAAPDILKSCQRLAELAKTALLGVEFAASPAGLWTFAGATPLPNLRLGGEAFLDILASVLKGELDAKE